MKNLKKSIIILATGTIFTIMLSTKAQAVTGKITEETVNLRNKPSTSSTIVEQLDGETKVEIIEEDGEWYKVKYKSYTGYISKKLIEVEGTVETSNNVEEKTEIINEQQEQQEKTEEIVASVENKEEIKLLSKYVINKEIAVKIIPLMNAIKSVNIPANSEIKIVDIMNNWFYIETQNNAGWVRKQVLENVINTTSVEQQPTEQKVEEKTEENTVEKSEKKDDDNKYKEYESAKIGYISGGTVNFRKEAATSGEVIKKLSKNTEVQILGETSDGWYKISLNGQVGYVTSQYVSDSKVAETTSRGMTNTQAIPVTSMETENIEETNDEQEENTNANENSLEIGNQIVEYAKQFLGCRYVSSGTTPKSGFDCSGFTKYVYANFGITLYRVSGDQLKNGTPVDKSDLVPGDLLIFNDYANSKPGHVGIYIGNNQFIHASNPSDGVKITSMSDSYYLKRYVGARRVF